MSIPREQPNQNKEMKIADLVLFESMNSATSLTPPSTPSI